MNTNALTMNYENVIYFWFNEIEPKQWWIKDPKFDQSVKTEYQSLHHGATRCELYHWRSAPLGRLAEIIILDQFSRNIYRNTPLSFVFDPLALALAQEAIRTKTHAALTPDQQSFLFMPFMHSESKIIHGIALALFTELGLKESLEAEKQHKRIIERFSRYPHRNDILGRESTEEEKRFLREPGSSF